MNTDHYLSPAMQHLADQLISKQNIINSHTATIGFDGFIDSIVKLVKKKGSNGQSEFFTTKEDWGNYILEKKSGNFSVELQQQQIKIGGNMPNMAAALAKLGISVNCVGAMGYPVIDPLFSKLPALCKHYSFAPPGTCQAIEFDDGKMMLAAMDELNKVDWKIMKERIPIAVLIKLFDNAQLIGLLNWGELTASTSFWNGLLQEVLPFVNSNNKTFFVDLSDCSSRTKDEMTEALSLLKKMAAYGKVVLSVNHNESIFIHNALFERVNYYNDIKAFGKKLFTYLEVDTLLLHNRDKAVVFRTNEFAEKKSFFMEAPKLLTGAGDNFNAGFCFAQLMDCCLEDSLLIAHLISSYYIKNGESAGWNDLMNALRTV
ncbi:MAG: hypothetical protein ABJC98_22045 [Bacteroidota bacterium]